MKVTISQELLAGALASVGKAVSARSINPVLGYVRIVAEPDTLTLTATDGDFTIRRSVAVSGAEPGRA
ncbi:MAG: DNA polymerase III subunit beta, partial [bacterium]|nr:DNA polymerase III subunit beta [bacterium]